MPVASRSDCTEMDVDLELDFKFDGTAWTMELQTMAIAFNACQGINRNGKEDNNDLWAYANRLHMEGLYDYDDMLVMTSQLVGDQPDDQICRDAEEKMLHERGYALGYSHDETTRIPLVGKGFLALDDSQSFTGPLSQNDLVSETGLLANGLPILEYVCANCYISHQHIFYKRLTPIPAGANIIYSIGYKPNNGYGLFNQDFELYSTLEDAIAGENKWSCPDARYNYNAGFPGECSPNGDRVRDQNLRFYGGSKRTHGALYLVGSTPFEHVPSIAVGPSFGPSSGSAFKTEDGTYYLTSTGDDVTKTKDSCQFMPLSTSTNVELVVKIEEFHSAEQWSKAGLMIRESDAPDARNVFFLVSNRHGVRFQTRLNSGSDTNDYGSQVTAVDEEVPLWMKLTKVQNEFTGYLSTDGETWERFDLPRHVDMDPATMMAGLAVSAHMTNGLVAEAKFSSVSAKVIDLSTDYETVNNGIDIGNAANSPGLSEMDPNTGSYKITGGGRGPIRMSDGLRFTYFETSDDSFTVEATIASIDPSPSSDTSAGIMIRKSLDPGSEYAYNALSNVQGTYAQHRTVSGENSSSTIGRTRQGTTVSVRITKSGKLITFERSFDGTDWKQIYLLDADWAEGPLFVGMSVASAKDGHRATAVFENWSLTPLSPNQYVPRAGAATSIVFENGYTNVGGYRGSVPGIAFESTQGLHLATTAKGVHDDSSDQFGFLPISVSPSGFEIVVHLSEMKHFNHDSQAGLMIRESMAPDAKQIFLFARGHTGKRGTLIRYRASTGQAPARLGWSSQVATEHPPMWLKIVKKFNEFRCYTSADGVA